MSESLLISDLHLSADRPETTAFFLRFLEERAPQADRLFILGDLFDAWIGDDDRDPPAAEIIAGLRALTDRGVEVLLQRGNRDFLLGRRFARATGSRILADPHRMLLHGVPTLLMHGDLLCTDDRDYQRLRRRLRNPLVQWLFLARPLARRRRLAADYRRRSGEAVSLKAGDIMDVNAAAVSRYMGRHGVRRLIHGHTHRQAVHEVSLDGDRVERIVLGDWSEGRRPYLRVDDCGSEHLRFAE